jgi:hypothetical protein
MPSGMNGFVSFRVSVVIDSEEVDDVAEEEWAPPPPPQPTISNATASIDVAASRSL